MATSKINTRSVSLRISFEEAAALHALLASIDEATSASISDSTLDVFATLDVVRDDLEQEGLWPQAFKAFIQRRGGLNPLR